MSEYVQQEFSCVIPMTPEQQDATIEALELIREEEIEWDLLQSDKSRQTLEALFPAAAPPGDPAVADLAVLLLQAAGNEAEQLAHLRAEPLKDRKLCLSSPESDHEGDIFADTVVQVCRALQNRFELPAFGFQWSESLATGNGCEHGGGAVALIPGKEPIYYGTGPWLMQQLERHAALAAEQTARSSGDGPAPHFPLP